MKHYQLTHTRGYYGLDAVLGTILEGTTSTTCSSVRISGAELIKHGAIKGAYCPHVMYNFDADQVKEMQCNPLLL